MWRVLLLVVLALPALAACGIEDSGPPTVPADATALRPPAGAIETGSGLAYVDTLAGTGATPTMEDRVSVHYTGRLAATGQVFETTASRGEPATFSMAAVIPGFSEALSTMQVGGKRTVYIPAALGYAGAGKGPVPPDADLVFDIELVAIR